MWVGESSFLSTGYSTYSLEVLNRIYHSNRYELAEFGSYGNFQDQRASELPWNFFFNVPNPDNKQEVDAYGSSLVNEWGAFKFESVVLQFRPDIVCDIRDNWAMSFERFSPLRRFYNLVWMPTCDATPQKDSWINDYLNADACLAYNDWSLQLLREQGGNKWCNRLKCAASPGADLETLYPIKDKEAHKLSMGLPPNSIVLATLMRNQKRKLFPDLIKAFSELVKESPKEIAENLCLLIHSTYPDCGFNFPELVKQSDVAHKIFFSYFCTVCNGCSPKRFCDARSYCPKCKDFTCTFPMSNHGASRHSLRDIYNCADLYVHLANSEGFGMPQVEAAACGVPIASVDYSAMSDVITKLQGIPIKVLTLSKESETGCYRAIPDIEDLKKKVLDFVKLPYAVRIRMGQEIRKKVEYFYNYNKTAKIWMDVFDQFAAVDHKYTWDSPPNFLKPNNAVPQKLNNEEFVRWCCINIACRPDLINSHIYLRMIRSLNWACGIENQFHLPYYTEECFQMGKPNIKNYNRKDVVDEFLFINQQYNIWEQERCRK